jgi:hypothetical protein
MTTNQQDEEKEGERGRKDEKTNAALAWRVGDEGVTPR